MHTVQTLKQRIDELEEMLEKAECKSDILTNLLKEANAEFSQALEKVTTSEANFRTIIENAPEAIYIFDTETHRLIDCNPFTIKWLGYGRDELLHLKVEDILERSAAGVQDNIRKVLKNGFVHIQERRFRKKSGALVDAEVTGTVIQLQGRKCFVALVRDITERKKFEELKRYKEFFENVSDPVIINDAKGDFLEVNDVTCQRFGYPRRQLLKMSFKDISRPDQYGVLKAMGRKISRGETIQFELDIRPASGEAILHEFHSRPIAYRGKPAVLSVARDLSFRKHMETALIRTERLSAVGEMASGVAHNFNNLLQMIMGASEAALEKLSTGEIRKCHGAIATIGDAAQRGADIVQRIKDFTPAKNDDDPGVTQVFDVGQLIVEAVQLTRPLWRKPAAARKYRVNYIRPLGAWMKGQPSEIYEVLVNLIRNGIEAMPKGGVLTLSAHAGNGIIRISAADTGIGIAEKNRRRIFQPFFTTKGSKSSGLGLSSSYGIVKKHNGDMHVQSTPGTGTTFHLTFPLACFIDRPCRNSKDQPADAVQTRLRLLVIDDEINILKMMAMIFEDTEIDLLTANNAEAGLTIIRNGRPNAILCDYGMDDMNGLEVGSAVKTICRQMRRPKIPFLLYTGLNTHLLPEQLESAGVDHVVKKPVPAEKLRHILQDLTTEPAVVP